MTSLDIYLTPRHQSSSVKEGLSLHSDIWQASRATSLKDTNLPQLRKFSLRYITSLQSYLTPRHQSFLVKGGLSLLSWDICQASPQDTRDTSLKDTNLPSVKEGLSLHWNMTSLKSSIISRYCPSWLNLSSLRLRITLENRLAAVQ